MERVFRERVTRWIETALRKKRLSLNELIRSLPGVHPKLIAEHVRGDKRILEELPVVNSNEPFHSYRLPVPHPLDFDWRFVESSRQLLLDRVLVSTGNEDNIILLGAPTVFRAAIEQDFPRNVTLVDKCGRIGGLPSDCRHRVVTADLMKDGIPPMKGKVVVTDPPWYEDYTTAFLWTAAKVTEYGGTVLFSVAPEGTRPGIEEEWARAKSFARSVGLDFICSERCLRYKMPPFEQNALRAGGLFNVEHDWRPGELWTLSRTHTNGLIQRPLLSSEQEEWAERSISGVRFRVRDRHCARFGDPRLISIVPGDVLDSVSRRDPRRSEADVWTSGNRVYKCFGTNMLLVILDSILIGTSAEDAVQTSMGRLLTDQERLQVGNARDCVIEIARLERIEYASSWEG